MSDVLFPAKGQHFGVSFTDGTDRSYREDVFVCIASDAHRVVSKFVTRSGATWNDRPMIFYRGDWTFQNVDELLEAVYFPGEQATQPLVA